MVAEQVVDDRAVEIDEQKKSMARLVGILRNNGFKVTQWQERELPPFYPTHSFVEVIGKKKDGLCAWELARKNGYRVAYLSKKRLHLPRHADHRPRWKLEFHAMT